MARFGAGFFQDADIVSSLSPVRFTLPKLYQVAFTWRVWAIHRRNMKKIVNVITASGVSNKAETLLS